MGKIVGIPYEHRPFEYRVGLVPHGVSLLVSQGHTVIVETGAGVGSGFNDNDYERAGARIVYSAEEVFRRADIVLKVLRPTEQEVDWMHAGQVVMGFMMMANFPQSRIDKANEKGINLIAYELIQTDDGELPILRPISEIGGMMTAQIAAQYLQNNFGGTGKFLGNIPGVPPADVIIVGAGAVGLSAASAFYKLGTHVIVLDDDLERLRRVHEIYNSDVTTMIAYPFNLKKVCKFADVVIAAVQILGQPAPVVITKEMVEIMHPGALIIDMSIDQGGAVETSRLTFHDNPTFVKEGVTHYCVPNVPGVVGRTATHAFLNAAWPYLEMIMEMGIEDAINNNEALRRGVVTSNMEMA